MNFKQQVNLVVEAPTKEHPQRKFQLTSLLGSGSEGGAYLASAINWGNNPKQVVIKLQKNMRANEKDFLTKLIQYQIEYENGNNQNYLPSYLIKIYEYFQWKDYHCVIMEVGKESLYEYITNNRNIPIEQRVKICFEICYPIYFLHSQKLIHRDIKPEKFIKVGDIYKLIDFGLVRGSASENKTQFVGTAIFQAPEIVENSNSYTEKVDIWSLSCVFYEILSTQPLFDGQTILEVTTSIRNHKNKPDFVINKIKNLQVAQYIQNILIEMMAYQENKRPTIEWVFNQFKNYFNQPPNQPQPQEQIVEYNQQFQQIQSRLNALESQIREKDSQIKTLNQNMASMVQSQSLEQDKQMQQLKKCLDEQNNFHRISSKLKQIRQSKIIMVIKIYQMRNLNQLTQKQQNKRLKFNSQNNELTSNQNNKSKEQNKKQSQNNKSKYKNTKMHNKSIQRSKFQNLIQNCKNNSRIFFNSKLIENQIYLLKILDGKKQIMIVKVTKNTQLGG